MNNSLTQYLELYEAHRADIDSHAPQALNRLRDAAFEALNKAGRLPRKGDEGYARTDIDAIFAPDFGINIMREVPDTVPEYDEARRMLKFLDNFIPIAPDEIPPTSVLREFIGGSSFTY